MHDLCAPRSSQIPGSCAESAIARVRAGPAAERIGAAYQQAVGSVMELDLASMASVRARYLLEARAAIRDLSPTSVHPAITHSERGGHPQLPGCKQIA